MYKLILLILVIGCGADPDDYQVQESDGCRSDDIECQAKVNADAATVAEEKTDSTTSDESESEKKSNEYPVKEEDDGDQSNTIIVENNINVIIDTKGKAIDTTDKLDNCQNNKICRGFELGEVKELIGEPETVEIIKRGYKKLTYTYDWYADYQEVCARPNCYLVFDDNNKLVEQKDVKGELIDYENY